ncbi:major facilitator superfamily domain-containing protein 1 isoform X7 [Apteryx rowi]|uniref:major facilitator superfamily domain-containing protein 1 isoform X7 n=1 Tax=Apteryx rowi TaxID=308060 RepID=UPI000E1D1E27|nr:major facilitator superfamily domain-containing protein 1 isoform X7 [Apteryx rowi]
MCFLGFGSYFCYDNPAALQTQVQADMKVNTARFMALYAWYSWPNVVLCFFGGFLIDRVFGIRLGTIIFSIFVCVGQVIFALGALFNAFWLMEAGRFVFGIGGESLAVAQNTYAVSWFKGKELNLVFGLQLSMARIGSTVNMNIMGWIYSRVQDLLGRTGHSTLGLTLMIGGITCLFSLACALILAYLDKRAEKLLCKEQGKTVFARSGLLAACLCPVAHGGLCSSRTSVGNCLWLKNFYTLVILCSCVSMQSIQNLGLAIIAIAAGMILDTRGYLFLEVFFSACICLSLIAVVMLYFVNHLTGGDLNWSAKKREKLQKVAATEAEEQERLRRQNEDDLAKLRPKADDFSLRNRYLSKLGAQVLPDNYSSYLSTMAHRSMLK